MKHILLIILIAITSTSATAKDFECMENANHNSGETFLVVNSINPDTGVTSTIDSYLTFNNQMDCLENAAITEATRTVMPSYPNFIIDSFECYKKVKITGFASEFFLVRETRSSETGVVSYIQYLNTFDDLDLCNSWR